MCRGIRELNRLLILLTIIVLIISCNGKDGQVYLAYSWSSSPQYLYDTNPRTPSVVYNGVYFEVEDGSYYVEYVAWDGSGWYFTYFITSDKGGPFFENGEDGYVEIVLYSFGPQIYNWSSPRSGNESSEHQKLELTLLSDSGIESDLQQPLSLSFNSLSNLNKGPIEMTQVLDLGYIRVKLEAGRLEI